MSTRLIEKFKEDWILRRLINVVASVLCWLANRFKEVIGFDDQILERRLQLCAMLNKRLFEIEDLVMISPELSGLPELRTFSDTDRGWLVRKAGVRCPIGTL